MLQDLNTKGEFTETLARAEKMAIKKLARKIGLTLFAVFGVMFFWSVPVLIVTNLMGIPIQTVQTFLSKPVISMLVQAVIMLLMVLLPFAILAKTEKIKVYKVINFSAPKKETTVPFIMATAVYGFLISAVTGVFLALLEGFGIKVPEIDMVYPTDLKGVAITIIAVVVLPALVEEFAIRGVVLSILRPFGDGFAILCSSVVFGLMHASITQIPYTFLFGIILAIAVIKTESIWTAVVLHAINNGLSVAFGYFEISLGVETTEIIEYSLICIMIVISVIGLVLLFKRDSQALKISPSKTILSDKKKSMYFILSPTIIICFVASVLFGFLFR